MKYLYALLLVLFVLPVLGSQSESPPSKQELRKELDIRSGLQRQLFNRLADGNYQGKTLLEMQWERGAGYYNLVVTTQEKCLRGYLLGDYRNMIRFDWQSFSSPDQAQKEAKLFLDLSTSETQQVVIRELKYYGQGE